MVHSIQNTELIDVNELNKEERRFFFEKLFILTKKIFGGVDKDDFDSLVSNPEVDASKILIYKNKLNEWVGYFALHRFTKMIDEQPVCVFRSQLGLLIDYRRQNAGFSFAVKEIFNYKIRHLSQEVYFFVSIINPSMYSITCKLASTVYPSPNTKVPEHIKHIIEQCAYFFNFPIKEGDSFWVRSSHWYPLHSKQEEDYWKNTRDKYVNYYTLLNPDFLEGKGVLTLVPVNSVGSLFSIVKVLYYTLRKKSKHFLQQLFTKGSLLPPPKKESIPDRPKG